MNWLSNFLKPLWIKAVLFGKDNQRHGKERGPIRFLGLLPKTNAQEAGRFFCTWNGEAKKVTIGIKDDVLTEWGFKMDHGRLNASLVEAATGLTLSEVLMFAGYFKIAEFLERGNQPHDHVFSRNDFKRGKMVVDLRSALEMLIVNGKWIHEEVHKGFLERCARDIKACAKDITAKEIFSPWGGNL